MYRKVVVAYFTYMLLMCKRRLLVFDAIFDQTGGNGQTVMAAISCQQHHDHD